jgi:hypothetical protein
MRAAWPTLLAVAAATAACGLLPEDDFTGKRVGDGIAPWQDLGPVRVCLGNEYLGPADEPAGGMCVDDNGSNAPCVADGDCRSREACVCGRCTVAFCATAADCGPGRVCTFSQNRCDVACVGEDDCDGPEECINNRCRGRCLADADCQAGEICDSQNVCSTAACGDDGDCLAGERCDVQRTPRQVVEPAAAIDRGAVGGPVVLWLELGGAVQRDETAIWRAVSADGVRFTMSPGQPVLEDGGSARAPSVIRTALGWTMYYEFGDGAELRVATSVDGIAWGAPTTALRGGTGAGAARAPSAVALPDGTVAVYYQVGDGAAIALATGAPGGPLTAQGPVLRPQDVEVPRVEATTPAWTDVQRVTSPHALLTEGADGPSLRLWFAAFGVESGESVQFGEPAPIPPNYSVGYAAGSVDDPAALRPWPYGPVADRVEALLEHREELTPAVLQLPAGDGLDDAYLMYFVEARPAADATGAAGPFVLGRLGVLGNGAFSATTGP